MNAKVRERTVRRAHARISAGEQRTGNRTGLLVLIIVFVAVVAILLRLAEFAGHGVTRAHPHPPPAGVVLPLG